MLRAHRLLTALIVALAVAVLGAPAQADPLPVNYSGIVAIANAAAHPDTDPPGSNDWSCHPTAAHPNPVILLHGTILNKTQDWNAAAPLLHNAGYCVFAPNYGQIPGPHVGLPGSAHTNGGAPVAQSAAELSTFVDKVRAATGVAKVDIVGHSQGGMMPRYYLRFLGGAAKVGKLIALAPSNHGTTVLGLRALPGTDFLLSTGLGPSVHDQLAGSDLLTKLNAGSETVPGVDYTVIESNLDEVVTPYTSAFLHGDRVDNILLQQQCPTDLTEHLGITYDPVALRDVMNALDPAHATPPNCALVLPVDGGGLEATARHASSHRP